MKQGEYAIISLFEKNPCLKISIRQISKKCEINYRTAYDAVSGLIAERVINCEKIGATKHCSLNFGSEEAVAALSNVSFRKYISFLNSKKGLSPVLKEIAEKAAKTTRNLHSVIIFGSYAKGEETKRSDLDVLAIAETRSSKKLMINISSVSMRYGNEINTIVMDSGMFLKNLREKSHNVIKEAVTGHMVIYGHERFWRLVSEAL